MSATVTCKPGQQVELGRYETPTGTRALVGRRIDGVVHVYDFAVGDPARAYFVEAGFESKTELAALVADYLRQARLLGACPMGRDGLDHIAGEPNRRSSTFHTYDRAPARRAA
jgi:hypothetical protein